jgi:hypothetical protein
MGYLGNSNVVQNFTPAVDYFNGNGSATAFTLSRTVGSAFDIQAFIENVPQNPSSAFTVAGNVITFTSAPPSGTNNIYVRYTSPVVQQVKPAPGTVGPTELNSNYSLWNLSGADINYTAGNVGIGRNPESARLDLEAASGQTKIILRNVGNTVDASTYIAAETGSSGDWANLSLAARHAVRFLNNNTENMRITTAGNVGIGINSPTAKLHVYGGSNNQFKVESSGAEANFTLAGTSYGQINNSVGDWYLTNDASAAMIFRTASTERVRINSEGSMLLNGTSSVGSNSKLQAYSDSGNGAQGWIGCFTGGSGGGRANQNVGFLVGQTNLRIYADWDGSGNPRNKINVQAVSAGVELTSGSTSWSAISDERLKDIIEPITDAVNKVSSLRTVIGKYKNEENKRRVFLIAQDVQAVLPEAVDESTDEEKTLGLRYTDVIPLLVASIKEQQAIIEDLKTRIEILENK